MATQGGRISARWHVVSTGTACGRTRGPGPAALEQQPGEGEQVHQLQDPRGIAATDGQPVVEDLGGDDQRQDAGSEASRPAPAVLTEHDQAPDDEEVGQHPLGRLAEDAVGEPVERRVVEQVARALKQEDPAEQPDPEASDPADPPGRAEIEYGEGDDEEARPEQDVEQGLGGGGRTGQQQRQRDGQQDECGADDASRGRQIRPRFLSERAALVSIARLPGSGGTRAPRDYLSRTVFTARRSPADSRRIR